MHYLVVFCETDISAENLIRTFRQNPIKIDKEKLKQYNLCECMNYTFPVIRELRFFEFDVLDPASENFEKVLASLGFRTLNVSKWYIRIFDWLLRRIGIKKQAKIEAVKLEDVKGRLNSRSFVILKKADDEFKENQNFVECKRCKKPVPVDWT